MKICDNSELVFLCGSLKMDCSLGDCSFGNQMWEVYGFGVGEWRRL